MSVENPENTNGEAIEINSCNGEEQPDAVNGFSNGHVENGDATAPIEASTEAPTEAPKNSVENSSKHKSSSKDKHRDRDRDHHKSSKSSHRDKDSDRHKHSSSSNKDKHRDRERDKDRDKNRDKDKDKSEKVKDNTEKENKPEKEKSDKEKERSDKDRSDKDKNREKHKSSSSTHKSSSHNKDRHRDKERDKDKDKERSKEHRDKDKEKTRDKDKERSSKDEKPRESNDKDKERSKDHKSSSSSSKNKERSDKDKDRHRSDKDKEKDRHKSSSSKDKHSSSSKSKDKDRERDRDKDRDRKDKERRREKDKHRSDKEKSSKTEIKNEIKIENGEVNGIDETNNVCTKEVKIELEMLPNDYQNHIKIEGSQDISQVSSCDYSMSQFRQDETSFELKNNASQVNDTNNFDNCSQDPLDENNDAEDDEDVPISKRKEQTETIEIIDDDDDEDIPLYKRKAQKIEDDDEDDEDIPLLSRKKPKQEKQQDSDDEDVPLINRKKVKKEEVDSDEDMPLMNRKKSKKDKSAKKKIKREADDFDDEDEEFDEKPKKKKVKKEKSANTNVKIENASPTKPGGRKKKEEEPEDVWRWWEEEKRDDSVKWNFLEHKGPVFAPEYERLPKNVKFYYDKKEMSLSEDTEEVACFYAKMLNHDYVTKKVFNDNFFKDWRKTMTSKEKDVIKDLNKCNFTEMHSYFTAQSEKNKNRSKEEKLALKEKNEALIKEYGFCTIDGHKEKIGNFRLEPPGLFRGRGEHPKMGMVKRRLRAEEISINCSKNSKVPEPPKGHRWKEVKHDNTVTWLASWIENVQGQGKYIMLNPSSKLKGEKDFQKYETARRLDKHIGKIRNTYRDEWKSKEMKIRQRGVALYFIDILALRAGNEKDEDQADTVGCCSLRVEHVQLRKKWEEKECVVIFDFLGKDSIRYYNEVEVEKRVFKNLELFKENKKEGDELFDRLNTSILNEHLRELMEGLTAKVFRTYNASITLQKQLDKLTEADATVPEKLLAYNRANRAVAVLCNHQRSVPKTHEKSMENLKEKIRQKRELIDDCETEYEDAKRSAKRGSMREKIIADKKGKHLERLKDQLKKLELQETDRDENKTIALGTSKLNYLDPRISVAWCKKYDVPIDKIFNKTQRDKFRWAIHMADENYRF